MGLILISSLFGVTAALAIYGWRRRTAQTRFRVARALKSAFRHSEVFE